MNNNDWKRLREVSEEKEVEKAVKEEVKEEGNNNHNLTNSTKSSRKRSQTFSSRKFEDDYAEINQTSTPESISGKKKKKEILKVFQDNVPQFPLINTPLEWHEVYDQVNNSSSTRLLLVNEEKNKAYDADFGFQLTVPLLYADTYSIDQKLYFSPRGKIFSFYTLRNEHTEDIFGNISYKIPFFQCEVPIEGLQWYLCENNSSFLFGFALSKAKITNLKIIPVRYLSDASLLQLSDFTDSLFDQNHLVLEVEINHAQHLYLDFWQSFQGNILGNHLKKDCQYGNVYKGIELTPSPPPPSTTHLHHHTASSSSSTAQRQVFSFHRKHLLSVVIKIVAFDYPLHSLPPDLFPSYPSQLSELRYSFQKTCQRENILNEIEIMEFLTKEQQEQCPKGDGTCCFYDLQDPLNTIRFPELLNVQVDNYNLFAISTYYHGGNILEFMLSKRKFMYLEEYQIQYVFKQLLIQIDFLHRCGIAHLDISPENIMLEHDGIPDDLLGIKCLLIDFGLATSQSYHSGQGRFLFLDPRGCNAGKPCFHCPELVTLMEGNYYRGHQPYDPKKVDVWQLGILLYILLVGTKPFKPMTAAEGATLQKQYQQQQQQEQQAQQVGLSLDGDQQQQQQQQQQQLQDQLIQQQLLEHHRALHEWIKLLDKYTIHQKPVVWKAEGKEPQILLLRHIFPNSHVLSLLNSMLAINPEDRPDVDELLQHPWLAAAPGSSSNGLAGLGSTSSLHTHGSSNNLVA